MSDREAFPGELDMLHGLVATLHAVAEHGDLADVRRVLAEYQRDEQDAYAEAGAGSPTAAPKAFQPGHLYAYAVWRFHCAAVTAHPATGEQQAIGWIRISDGSWTTHAYSAAEWDAPWTDITTTGEDGR
ncbi:hypothetical protein [Streptomyces asoensis]|uniref:SnoaL-like domain-containing protein n=1 Tax=Streptomyces asoensis TaxID=249586 RepID=A0ABQ3RYT9_9ACTN|nr:hypothetical protein [Streptomyces asoensis]GGQ48558.1 hypothetical protein GCM10010496_08480 [Streptomyces asoensis]GHI61040.1 hypothetical protein Saso_26900 [Streptomyces asoensis]